jgi:protease-4
MSDHREREQSLPDTREGDQTGEQGAAEQRPERVDTGGARDGSETASAEGAGEAGRPPEEAVPETLLPEDGGAGPQPLEGGAAEAEGASPERAPRLPLASARTTPGTGPQAPGATSRAAPPRGGQGGATRAATSPPPRPGRPAWLPWAAGGCGGCLLLVILFFAFAAMAGMGARPSASLPGGEKIGLIYVEGPIMGGRGAASLFGISGGADVIVRQLDRARRDRSIKAVVLRINSPGGSAAASQEIFQEVMKLRKARKPVVASMGDVAASGGYYVAAAADKIMANGSTMTGSIGVIMEFMNLQGLYEKLGLGAVTIKSGRFKDIGSATRPLTQDERQLLQAMIDDVYDQFVTDVVAGRKILSREEVRRLADGRIFTGRQAQKLKLVDELGNLQDAFALAGKMAGIAGRPAVEEVGRRGVLDIFLGEDSGYGGLMRPPMSGVEDERVLNALRHFMRQQALPR